MPILICLVFAFMITKAIHDGRTDQELARKGIVSPRLQAKYGDGAKAKTERYGLKDFVADAWSDLWQNRTEIRRTATTAARTATPSNPGRSKPSWRDRLRAVKGAVANVGRKFAQPVGGTTRIPTQPEPARTAPEPRAGGGDDVDTTRTCPTCGAKLTSQNGQWWHPDGPTCPNRPAAAKPEPINTPKEKPVTAPTGEAVNYETTVAELEAMIARARTWLEQVTAAQNGLDECKNHISDGQDAYREVAQAVPTMLEFLASKNLDATTLGLVGAIRDAMPASDIDATLAAIEEAETHLKKLAANAQTALDALEAALAHIQSTLGSANETVQSQLGGDSSFLGSNSAHDPHGIPIGR